MSFHNLSDNDWQSFIYAALLLIILLTSLFSRKEISLSKTLKYLSLWLFVALLLIIAYSYRFEFEDLTNRINGEINPSKAQIKDNQITIKAAQDGHFYINAKINNSEIRFMIDTGATNVSLSLKDAKKAGINIDQLVFNQIYQTANGKALAAATNLKELEIEGLVFRDVKASVNQSDIDISLLGMNFLKQMKKYEFSNDQLTLTAEGF